MFQVDTTNDRVYIGNPNNYSSAVTLVVASLNSTTEPVGQNGAIYYNTDGVGGPNSNSGGIQTSGTFRCFQQNHWQNCLGTPDISQRRWGYAAPAGSTSTLSTSGVMGALSQNGGAADTSQTEGNYVNYTTGATTGNAAGVTSAVTTTESQWKPKMEARVRTPATISSARDWVGLTNTSLTASDGGTNSFVGLRYSTSAGDTDWQCVAGDGTSTTAADTGVTVHANHYYDVIIDYTVSGTVICSVADNGGAYQSIYVNTHTPSAGTTLFPELSVTTLTNAATSLEAEYFYIEQQ